MPLPENIPHLADGPSGRSAGRARRRQGADDEGLRGEKGAAAVDVGDGAGGVGREEAVLRTGEAEEGTELVDALGPGFFAVAFGVGVGVGVGVGIEGAVALVPWSGSGSGRFRFRFRFWRRGLLFLFHAAVFGEVAFLDEPENGGAGCVVFGGFLGAEEDGAAAEGAGGSVGERAFAGEGEAVGEGGVGVWRGCGGRGVEVWLVGLVLRGGRGERTGG